MFATQYAKYIESEVLVAKNKLQPRNFYKISSYQYANGEKGTFTGPNATLIFLIAISSDRKLYCVKISEIRPEKFFVWLKRLVRPSITCEQIKRHYDNENFEKILIEDTVKGNAVFSKVKNDAIYKENPSAFRTYNLDGIKQIKTLYLDQNWFKNKFLLMNCYEPEDLNKDGIVTEEERQIYQKKFATQKKEKFKLT